MLLMVTTQSLDVLTAAQFGAWGDERRGTGLAIHELGDALRAPALPDSDAVHKVSIIPRGASAMVLRYGMSEALGNVAYDRDRSPFLQGLPSMPEARAYGEDTARAVDGAFRALVDAGFARAIKILERNRALLDRTAE